MAVDEALARHERIEATLRAQENLTDEERALLSWAMFDRDDLAVLSAAMRCLRDGRSKFEEAFGLIGNWREHAKAQTLHDLIRRIPTKPAARARARGRDILGRLRRYRESAVGFAADVRMGREPKGERGALLAVLRANDGKVPGFSTIRRALAGSPAGSTPPPLVEPATGIQCSHEDDNRGKDR